ncbi:MAG: hypothetical protein Q7U48_13640 [Hydrogenophaga sp.]|nr:hypothetical protein [Hydrogenophaga sp.]
MSHTDKIEYEVDQRDDGTFHITGPNDMELLIVPAKTEAQRQESKRLDWLLLHCSANIDSEANGRCYISAWLSADAPGNDRGASSHFVSYGKTHRECIDNFLAGNISRGD